MHRMLRGYSPNVFFFAANKQTTQMLQNNFV